MRGCLKLPIHLMWEVKPAAGNWNDYSVSEPRKPQITAQHGHMGLADDHETHINVYIWLEKQTKNIYIIHIYKEICYIWQTAYYHCEK